MHPPLSNIIQASKTFKTFLPVSSKRLYPNKHVILQIIYKHYLETIKANRGELQPQTLIGFKNLVSLPPNYYSRYFQIIFNSYKFHDAPSSGTRPLIKYLLTSLRYQNNLSLFKKVFCHISISKNLIPPFINTSKGPLPLFIKIYIFVNI